MLQALIRKGRVIAEEVPAVTVSPGSVLIRVVYSCISAGTEMSSVQDSRLPLIKRALQHPDKVVKAFKMLVSHGAAKTLSKAVGEEGIGRPTGYSLAGVVVARGDGVDDLKPGDRVAAAGAGVANHAEWVEVPRNLVMRIPAGLDFQSASTVTLGGIALQGVRRANIQLGEFVVVFGTGILGLLAIQLARLAGGRCIAVDIDEKRLELARRLGAELCVHPHREQNPTGSLVHLTGGHGADAVIFAASTADPAALSQALGLLRKKGRLVMVGVYGRELHREDLYSKEIDFLISTSYGPGRYDSAYEEKGLDYPYAYVRWTENRNMEEYLRLLSTGAVDVAPLVEASYPISEVSGAFERLAAPDRPLIVLLAYGQPDLETPCDADMPRKLPISPVKPIPHPGKIRVGLIGAGSFATGVHLPNLQKLADQYQLVGVCSRTGSSAKAVATRFSAGYATTDYHDILSDPEIDMVMICTRHHLHGRMVLESLASGKHTFVEKPLCTEPAELDAIKAFYGLADWQSDRPETRNKPVLMVGFNRRFSAYAREAKKHTLDRVNPLFIHYRMNAGYLPREHWLHGEEGGGRIVGEACHILDLFTFFTESQVRSLAAAQLTPKTESLSSSDNKAISLEYEDGSVATLEYFAVGATSFPKEYLEIHFDGKTIVVDDYKSMHAHGLSIEPITSRQSDKGQFAELIAVHGALSRDCQWPISLWDLVQTTELSFQIRH